MPTIRPEAIARERAAETGRGRDAHTPLQIPFAGWKDIAWRVAAEIPRDRLMMVAAGVTYYLLLAMVPTLSALVSVYGLVADPASVREQTAQLVGILPEGGLAILDEQLTRLATEATGTLGLTFTISLAIALWSANAGVKALFDALNVVYEEEEKRGFLRLTLVSLLFTLAAIVGAVLFLVVVVALPHILAYLPLGAAAEWTVRITGWVLMFLAATFALSALYRYGPSRARARWRWITPGALFAVVLILVASMLFSWYVANFGSYNATYGSLGALIGFMTWIWITVGLLLIGAEIDAEMEHQTARDSTRPPDRPLGRRGAAMADDVGRAAGEG